MSALPDSPVFEAGVSSQVSEAQMSDFERRLCVSTIELHTVRLLFKVYLKCDAILRQITVDSPKREQGDTSKGVRP